MSEKTGIIYWCGGSGHAARSIPIANELRSRGEKVSIAGGGFGAKFVDMNGFEQKKLTEIDDPAEYSLTDFFTRTFTKLIPSSFSRLRDIDKWLKQEEPDQLITDDIFAIFLASIYGIEFYRVDHVTTDILPLRWSLPLKLYNSLSMLRGNQIFVTSLWKEEGGSKNITKIDPLAQDDESEEELDSCDILLSPGTWGKGFHKIRSELEEKGYNVRTVGDDKWELKKSMTPVMRSVDLVICTGFSSIADAAVAGTPVLVFPFLTYQKALAKSIEERELQGIGTVHDVDEAIEMAEEYCENEDIEGPEYDNGAPEIVDRILE